MRRTLSNSIRRAATPLFVALVAAAAIAVQAPTSNDVVDLPADTQRVLGVQGQVHYLPWDAAEFLAIAQGQNGSTTRSTSPVRLITSMVSALDGNQIAIDHWEDGYDADPVNAPGTTTEVFTLNEGQNRVLDNSVDTSNLGGLNGRGANQPWYDGGDKLVSTGALVVSAGGWPSSAGTLHAGAAAVPDVNSFGLDFVTPTGEDVTDFGSLWDYTGLVVLASQDDTTVDVAGTTITLDEGDSHLVDGGIDMGDTVSADKPVAVYLATGDPAQNYEGRLYNVTPTERLSASYVTPVGSRSGAGNKSRVFLYNPSASTVSVTATPSTGVASTVSVPAHGQANYLMPDNTGASFTASAPFNAIEATTTPESGFGGDSSSSYNWGISLIPTDALTPMVVIGYGPGSDDVSAPAGVDENDSAVWVAPVSDTTIYVDLDADPDTPVAGPLDPNGNRYDFTCTGTAFTPVIIKDVGTASCSSISSYDKTTGTGDNDMTGARIYTADGVSLAAAWGQIPGAASTGQPAIDMGTTVLPFPTLDLDKSSEIVNDDGDGEAVPGDTIRYTITITNRGISPVDDLTVNDVVPADTTYVPGSTIANGTPVTDPGTGTPFPLDEGGMLVPPVLNVGETRTVVYDLLVDDPLPVGVTEILNEITLESDYGIYTDINVQPVADPGSIGDRLWNDADADGVQDGGEAGLVGVSVELLNDSDSVIATTTTGANGVYSFANVYPGTYTVRVVAAGLPAGVTPTFDLDGTGSADKATVTLAAAQTRTDVDFGYVSSSITLQKTVYAGHDGGNSCPGSELVSGESGDDVTYCFRVTNTGAVGVVGVTVDDPDLDIDQSNMALESGNPASLAAGQSVVWSYNGSIDGDLVNHATATAYISVGGPSRTATDTAEVNEIGPGITLQKTVYRGQDGGASCDTGVESVTARSGDPVTWCFLVTNSGETNLSGITFSDPALGIADGAQTHALLTPGQTHMFHVDATADDDLRNTATARGTSPAGVTPTDDDAAAVDVIHPAISVENTIYKGHDSGAGCGTAVESVTVLSGAPVTWCFVVTNTGDVPLTGVTLTDPLLVNNPGMTLLSGSLATLNPGQSAVLYYAPNASVDVNNSVTAAGTPPLGANVTDLDTAAVDVIAPGIHLDKTVYLGNDGGAGCDTAKSAAEGENGEPLTWCFTITNTGDATLGNITLTDLDIDIIQTDATVLSGSLSSLAPGASVTLAYHGAGSAVDGDFVNTATAAGLPPENPAVSDQDDASVTELVPDFTVDKTVYAGHDDGASCPGGDLVTGRPADPVTWCVLVTNTGETDLDVHVVDAEIGLDETVTDLAPGEDETVFHEGTIDGDLVNTVTATGTTPHGEELPRDDTAELDEVHPAIQVDNTIYAGHDAGAGCEGGETLVRRTGNPVTWCFVVTNTGDVPLTGVTLADLALGIDEADLSVLSGSLATMAPGATTVLYLETSATADVDNDVTATGDAPVGPDVSDVDDASLDVIDPAIKLDKTVYEGHDGGASCPGGPDYTDEDGHPVTWCFVIENTGDSTLTDVTVADGDLGIDETDLVVVSGSFDQVDPGDTIVAYYETTIDGALVNDAIAWAVPLVGPDVSDDGQASVDVLVPGIDVQKTVYAGHDDGAGCDGGELVTGQAGDPITWCFTVENTGDTDLDVTVEDAEIGFSDTVSLSPDEIQTLSFEGVIDGDLVPNTATATGETPDGHDVPDEDTAAVDEIHPRLRVDKTVYAGHDGGAGCEGGESLDAEVGDAVTWCFHVTNLGDVDLTDLTLLDPALGTLTEADVELASGDLALLPVDGELLAYYEDTTDVAVANTVTVGATAPDGTDLVDADTAAVDVVGPQIGIAKTVVDGPNSNGDGSYTLTYRLRVLNAGETRLDPVQVTDDLTDTFGEAAGFRVDEVTSTGFDVNPNYNGRPGGSVTLLTGAGNHLAVGEREDIEVTVTVTPGAFLGPYVNTAIATGTSPAGVHVHDTSDSGSDADPRHANPGEPGDTEGTDDPVPVDFPAIDLTVVKTVESVPPPNATAGTIDWGIVVTNDGPGDDPGPITVTDELDEQLTFESAEGDGWTCANVRQAVTCAWTSPLAAGEATTMIHVKTHVQVVTGDEVYANGAHVSSTGGETRTDNNDSAAEVAADFEQVDVPSTLPRTGATVGGLLLLAAGLILGGRQLQRRSRRVMA